jgi:uroporphyrinogen-III synthase
MKRVLITRAAEDAPECVNIFSARNLAPFVLPMIETVRVSPSVFKHSVYDYCILTSPAAVRYFDPHRAGLSISSYAAVGEVTAGLVRTLYGVKNILVPQDGYSAGFINIFDAASLEGAKILAPGAAKRARDLLSFFTDKGADLDSPALYETKAVNYELNGVNKFLFDNRIDAVTFFSPSAADAFMGQAALNGCAAVCLGETTATRLRRYGVIPYVSPKRDAAAMAEYIFNL